MRIVSAAILYFILVPVLCQVIPANRQVEWYLALQSYQYSAPVAELNVMDFGAVGDGITNDQPAVMSAISSLGGLAGYIYFPPGNYLFNNPLILPDSVILKGSSSDSSVLRFDFTGNSYNCISISGFASSLFIQLDGGFVKGSTWVITDSAFLFNPLDYAEIAEDNGAWDDVPASWANESVGQIVRISDVIGDTIFISSPLRIRYKEDMSPRIRRIYPSTAAGVECLKIRRIDQSSSGANISINLAAHCVVRGIESHKSVSSHVDITRSANILVEGCYFHHAFEYDGTSKHGYGVTLNMHSGECLITNNIFRYLRHAMMVKTGANGNVFAYNYSREVNRSEPFSDFSGDISLHGHYPFANLFEGNIVQNIIIDHYWGPSGPRNTFFRNRAENYGIIFTSGNPTNSNYQNIVGNDVIYNGISFLGGPYSITGTGHIEYGNNINGTLTPPGPWILDDTSYFLDTEPHYWNITDSWPSLGIPNFPGVGTIPAKTRWDEGTALTICPLYMEWTGIVNSDWTNPSNWKPYGVPGEAANIGVPGTVPSDPVVSSGETHFIRTLNVNSGGRVEVLNGSELIILR